MVARTSKVVRLRLAWFVVVLRAPARFGRERERKKEREINRESERKKERQREKQKRYRVWSQRWFVVVRRFVTCSDAVRQQFEYSLSVICRLLSFITFKLRPRHSQLFGNKSCH